MKNNYSLQLFLDCVQSDLRQREPLRTQTVKRTCNTLVCGVFGGFLGYSVQSQADTLNNAVNQLLKAGPNGIACEALIGTSLASDLLTGPLASDSLCGRTISFGGGTSSTATGGGAATATSLPTIVQKRLNKKSQNLGDGAGDSNDSISALGDGWNLFTSASYQSLDRTVTTFEDGYKSDVGSFTAGIDKQVTEQLLAGLTFNYSHQNGDFSSAGDFHNDAYGGLLYASYTPLENLFFQFHGGYAYRDYTRQRLATFQEEATNTDIAGFVDGSYGGNDFNTGILGGYDFSYDAITVGPRVGLNWVRNEYNRYSENGNSGLELRINEDVRTSLQSSVGAFASYSYSSQFGVIVPQVGIDWLHEFENDQRDIGFSFAGDTRNRTFTFQNEKPDRDFVEISAGTTLVLPNGLQAYAQYRALAGHSLYSSHIGSLGMRLEF